MKEWFDEVSAYTLPLIVDTPDGRRDISEWAAKQVGPRYALGFAYHNGIGDAWISARFTTRREVLETLQHGKTYDTKAVCQRWLGKDFPKKVRFVVEGTL